MRDLVIHLKSPATRLGLGIPGAALVVLICIFDLPFLNPNIGALLKFLVIVPASLCSLSTLDIFPYSIARREIEWRRKFPEAYRAGEWEVVPFLENLLVRVRMKAAQ